MDAVLPIWGRWTPDSSGRQARARLTHKNAPGMSECEKLQDFFYQTQSFVSVFLCFLIKILEKVDKNENNKKVGKDTSKAKFIWAWAKIRWLPLSWCSAGGRRSTRFLLAVSQGSLYWSCASRRRLSSYFSVFRPGEHPSKFKMLFIGLFWNGSKFIEEAYHGIPKLVIWLLWTVFSIKHFWGQKYNESHRKTEKSNTFSWK